MATDEAACESLVKIIEVNICPDETKDGRRHEDSVEEEEEGSKEGDEVWVGEAEGVTVAATATIPTAAATAQSTWFFLTAFPLA